MSGGTHTRTLVGGAAVMLLLAMAAAGEGARATTTGEARWRWDGRDSAGGGAFVDLVRSVLGGPAVNIKYGFDTSPLCLDTPSVTITRPSPRAG
jgi:hypothetical protein